MPIYEFRCSTCGSLFDKLVRSSAATEAIACPTCSSPDVKKRLSVISNRVAATPGASLSSAAACTPGGT
jgi:putative FmdB family regulatory protein